MEQVFHTEVLTREAKFTLEILRGQDFIKDFYLAGGTGLALQIGHRVSLDFDLFSNTEELTRNSRERIVRSLSRQGELKVELEEDRTSL